MGKTIVTVTPATPNGDIHVGHLSGPYLGADVYSRYLRSRKQEVIYVTGSDVNQHYVVTSAIRSGTPPAVLARECSGKIPATLRKAHVSVDAFTYPDDEHSQFIQAFLLELFDKGKFAIKQKDIYYNQNLDRYVYESFLSGTCPHCYAPTSETVCEACGHPNDAMTLLDVVSAFDPSHLLVKRSVDVVVLELERYRDEIVEFYQDKWSTWRPHLLQLVEETLSRPLPDYPITYLSDWGIPAPFPGFEGHVLNGWPEMAPGFIRSTAVAVSEKAGGPITSSDTEWLAASGNRLVQFLGYDNGFFFAVANLSLMLAHDGKYILPEAILTNEFYELDNFKFSTSKGNLIWASDLLDERSSDEVRYYLALSNPEYQKTNFTRKGMDKLVDVRLVSPWNLVVEAMNRLNRSAGLLPNVWYPVGQDMLSQAERLVGTYARYYDIETFSMQRNAENLSNFLIWLGRKANSLADRLDAGERLDTERAAELWHLVRLLPALIEPIMPDFAQRLNQALGDERGISWPDLTGMNSTQIATLPQGLLPDRRGSATIPRQQLAQVES